MRTTRSRRWLFNLLAACLLVTGALGGTSTTSNAASRHAVATYAALLSAIDQAKPGDVIELTADIVVLAELPIDKTLVFHGNGHTLSVPVPGLDDSGRLQAEASAFRVFNLTAGTLSISSMTIKGGAVDDAGSALLVGHGASLCLNAVTVTNAGGPACTGGGLANFGTSHLANCNIVRNGAAYGGGFLNSGPDAKLYIEGCSFSENRSLSTNGGGGAGENNAEAVLYVNNATFANNTSTELGGAINNYGATAYLLNSTFTGNVNHYMSMSGGALRIEGEVYLFNNLFAYNYSSNDGHAYVLNDVDAPPTQAHACLFHGSPVGGSQNVHYAGAADGSDDTLFSGGAQAKVLAADGSELGTATVYQPYLVQVAGATTASVPLKPGRDDTLCAGIKTGFSQMDHPPVVGYHDLTTQTWVTLTGSDASRFEVQSDQNGLTRGHTPVKGAVESSLAGLHMVKVSAATGGTVNGGTVYGDTYATGAAVTLTALPEDGYTFSHWSDASAVGTPVRVNPYTFTVSRSLTLTPVFETLTPGSYTITYVGNGHTSGMVPSSQAYFAPATISDTGEHLVKRGHVFSGWNTRANGSGTAYAVGDLYALGGNLTVYAQWEPGATVTFDALGGGSSWLLTSAYGATLVKPDPPLRKGWAFDGWYREPACVTPWSFAADLVSADMTLYAKWTPLAVTLTGQRLPEGTCQEPYHTVLQALGGSGRFTYRLLSGALPAGLTLSADGIISGTPSQQETRTFTVKASDTANAETATATFSVGVASKGTVATPFVWPAGSSIDRGEAVTLAVSTPDAAIYYTLNGDPPSKDALLYTGPITLCADTVIKAIAVKAGWDKSKTLVQPIRIKTYLVHYDGNGATGGNTPLGPRTYHKGDVVAVVGNPGELTRPGHRFDGWNTRADLAGSHLGQGHVFTVQGDQVLYAQWSLNSHVVVFEDWNGQTLKTQTVSHQNAAKVPVNPMRTGHRFTGWNTPFDCITADTNIRATYAPKLYAVSFQDWNGDVLKTQMVAYGHAADAPGNPARKGHTFVGWSSPFDNIASDTWISAQYQTNQYRISFDTGDGQASFSQSVSYNKQAKRPDKPEKNGFIFDAWYVDQALTHPYDFNSGVTQDLTLYAGWLDPAQVLREAATALTEQAAFAFAPGDSWEYLTDDFTLLSLSGFHTPVTWRSSNTSVVQLATRAGKTVGQVRRPEGKDAHLLMTATLSCGDQQVSKSFLLIVKQKGVSGRERRVAIEDAACVRFGDHSDLIPVYRTTVNNGADIDLLVLLPETVARLLSQKGPGDHLLVTLRSVGDQQVDETAFEIPQTSLSQLAENDRGLALEAFSGTMSMPSHVIKQVNQQTNALYVRFVCNSKEANAPMEAVQVVGAPWSIQTNMSSLATTINLPLGDLNEKQLLNADFLKTLCIYAAHDDGSSALLAGTLIYEGGWPTHMRFENSHYTRFQVVSLEEPFAETPIARPWALFYLAGSLIFLLVLFLVCLTMRRKKRTLDP